jgi:capsule biosynthesis phosphatase
MGGHPPFTLPTEYYTKFTSNSLMTLPDPTKTIVVDVDDTILTTINRDYENSRPKMEVIVGLRELKKAGWRIVLHTARGQGRSGGNIDLVREDVTREIETFCAKFDVPYDELILGKIWAAYYIDDRALRPEEFAARYQSLLGAK